MCLGIVTYYQLFIFITFYLFNFVYITCLLNLLLTYFKTQKEHYTHFVYPLHLATFHFISLHFSARIPQVTTLPTGFWGINPRGMTISGLKLYTLLDDKRTHVFSKLCNKLIVSLLRIEVNSLTLGNRQLGIFALYIYILF